MPALASVMTPSSSPDQRASEPSSAPDRRALLLVFLLALLARLAYLWFEDRPILFAHPYTYFTGAMRIAEHPDPVGYVLWSEEWRTWAHYWTIAPLYYLYAAGLFKLLGASLLRLQLLQCLTDALVAAGVARLGQRLVGPRGAWAGVLYALHWQALELPTQTLTENLHTPLLLAGVLLLAREHPAGGTRRVFAAGLSLGLSALTRSVSSAFVPILAFVEWNRTRDRAGLRRAAWLCVGAALVILPWTARNAFLVGDPVPIESAAYENMLWANNLEPREDYNRHLLALRDIATPAERRAYAWDVAVEGVRQHPGLFLEKVAANFRHLIRPEGLDGFLRVERSLEPWAHFWGLLADDLFLLAALPLGAAFLLAGRACPARTLMLAWCGYFYVMVVVAFHNEVRYRMSLWAYVAAAMVAGWAACRDVDPARRRLARLGALSGAALAAVTVAPYAGPAARTLEAWWKLQPALEAARRGNLPAAQPLFDTAIAGVPQAAWPYEQMARVVAEAGHGDAAARICRDALERGSPETTAARLMLPALLQARGREASTGAALLRAHEISWNSDPWLALEVAWARLPAPRVDEIEVGGLDYGAVRGFLHPRGSPGVGQGRTWTDRDREDGLQVPRGVHRWSRARAWLRLVPVTPAAAYDATLWLGVPPPGRLTPGSHARFLSGASEVVCELTESVAPCRLRVPAPAPGQPLLFELLAPVWNRAGEPADQGVRVERLKLTPAS